MTTATGRDADRPLRPGGAERLAVEITTRLDAKRFGRTLCVTRWSDRGHTHYGESITGWHQQIQDAGVRFLGLDQRDARDLPAWRPLNHVLGTTDVVHGHMFGSNVWAVTLGRATRVPVVVAPEHTWDFAGQRGRKPIDRHLIARGSSAFIACSREDCRRMIDIRYVPNGIDARAPTPGSDLRHELAIAPDAPIVGAVGSPREQKRSTRYCTPARLAERVPGYSGSHRRPGFRAPEARAVGPRPSPQRRGDAPKALAASDVAACSSDYEGSPLALMEYMEAARPVVATRVGAVPELIEPGRHGLLIERRDPAALAAGLAELLGDPHRRARMGTAAQARRRAAFDLDVMVGRLEDLYEELYARRPGSAPQ
jgi:glycosyltransferase involved in cell wall biosynthesis